jgi:sialic acid synthase SpsE
MSFIILRNGRRIGDYFKPYIIAELNTSHFGDIEVARDMIRQAKAAGCDCVKFQSWSAETLYSEEYYKENPIAKRFVKKFMLENSALEALAGYSNDIGIDFSSTPYSIEEARFLVDHCNVPFVKIASMELDNLPYLSALGYLQVPLVLSTGMGTSAEIIRAVETIIATGNDQLVILHCTSVYPSAPDIIRLKNITGLRLEFPKYPIGFSDHSIGIEIPVASVALGACLVEKHFTLDSKRIGMDNQMATEPAEMRSLVDACNNVYKALGGSARLLSVEEQDQVAKMRRSMVAKKIIAAGSLLKKSDIEFKRPGNGISPADAEIYIGLKVIRDFKVGDLIKSTDLSH